MQKLKHNQQEQKQKEEDVQSNSKKVKAFHIYL